MTNFFIVAAGGALGACGRYAISLLPVKTAFPILTLCTNVIGAVLIGFVTGLFLQNGAGKAWLTFWKTGVCGGFTTFSAFSLEAVYLFEGGHAALGVLYVVLSTALCLLGVLLGRLFAARALGQ